MHVVDGGVGQRDVRSSHIRDLHVIPAPPLKDDVSVSIELLDDETDLVGLREPLEDEARDLLAVESLWDLREHGLVNGEINEVISAGGSVKSMPWARITAAGLDFIEDDGGLKAILKRD